MSKDKLVRTGDGLYIGPPILKISFILSQDSLSRDGKVIMLVQASPAMDDAAGKSAPSNDLQESFGGRKLPFLFFHDSVWIV